MAIIPAFFTILYYGEDALGGLLVLSQVVLSLQLGFAIIPLIHFNSDKFRMKEYAIKTWVKILAWISAVIIIGLNVKLVIEQIQNWIAGSAGNTWWIYVVILPLVIGIIILLLYITITPLLRKQEQPISIIPHGEAQVIGPVEPLAYKKVGITVDFSASDRNTIRHALIQGGQTARYELIHVVETAAARFHGETTLDMETQADTANLLKYQQNLADLGYQAEISVGYGTASQAIARIVKEKQLELLVMGAHGHKGLSDLIFGTTVNSVRHKVNIPILIIK